VTLRLAADRLDVQVVDGGRLHSVQATADGAVRELSASGPGFDHLASVPWRAIDTAAARRLASSAARRRGVAVTRVDYLALLSIGGEVRWSLFFRDGTHFTADAQGRGARRV
jgi:hypothetical protein